MTQENKTPRSPKIEIEHETFSDVFSFNFSPWSIVLDFGKRMAPGMEEDLMDLRVRMPLQQAKAMAFMILRAVRNYEDTTKVQVDLPENLLKGLNIPMEDWRRLSIED